MSYNVIYEHTGKNPFVRLSIPREDGYVALVNVRQTEDGMWTYRVNYGSGAHPQQHELFATRDAAAYAAYQMMRQVEHNGPLTRSEYERMCAQVGLAPEPDSAIANGYYGDYSPEEYGDQFQRLYLMKRRAGGIEQEQEAMRQPIADPEEVLADCGHYCPRALLMNATIGTSCPDCYDDSERRHAAL